MSDPEELLTQVGKTGMAGFRVESASEMPTQKALVAYIKEAVQLNAVAAAQKTVKKKVTKKAGKKKAAKKKTAKTKTKKPPVKAPIDLLNALRKTKGAKKAFDEFSPSHKREYVEWIEEAKRDATREKRIAQAVEWMAEGKPRDWKYMNC